MTFVAVLAALVVYDLAKLMVKALAALGLVCALVVVGSAWLAAATLAHLCRTAAR